MSKCLKCGAALPPVGECPACAAAAAADTLPGHTAVPSLLDKDIHIDRRKTPERTPAVTEPAVPSFADLARGPMTPPGMTPARPAAAPAPRTQTPPLGSQAQVAPQPPAQRLPVPPPMPAAQAMPPPQRLPVPSPAPQAAAAPPPVPRPGVQASAPPAQPVSDDPDSTAPGHPPFAPPPASESRSAMASPAQRAELPTPSEPSHAPPLAAEPGTGSRQHPAPVSVVTFSPPSRLPVPPAPGALSGDEQLTPRLPHPTVAPEAQPRARTSGVAKADSGVQELHARPASLWRRLLSFTIDTAALVGVAFLYITLASSIAGVKAPSSQGLTELDSVAAWLHALKSVLLPGIILLLVLATVYCAVAAFLWNGRTLGRLLLGLRLVDTHGVAPAPTRAIIRALLSVLSFGLFLGGFWMALFDRRGQTLHDKLTSTFVIQPS
ncbi:RDD family protein [Hyalangium gracile]|uniref:RDD family protein n=1 Tax=Hyalangium gracile TaxID=394092 RepID=UPI001CCA3BF6|nr:RDD family protein [Hyalangium gracile]